MAIIYAKGKTIFGNLNIRIIGEKKIEKIETKDNVLDWMLDKEIRRFKGVIANNYHAEHDSMLNAYLWACNMFKEENVTVDGEIEPLPFEEGVIY